MVYICLENFLPNHTFWQSINRAGRVTMGTTSFRVERTGESAQEQHLQQPTCLSDWLQLWATDAHYMHICNRHFASRSCRPRVRWDRCSRHSSWEINEGEENFSGNPLWTRIFLVEQRKGKSVMHTELKQLLQIFWMDGWKARRGWMSEMVRKGRDGNKVNWKKNWCETSEGYEEKERLSGMKIFVQSTK